MGNGIRDEFEVTLTIKTLDGDPRMWNWTDLVGDEIKVSKTEFKRRVLEDAEKTFETYVFVCDPEECDALIEFTARDGFGFPLGEIAMKCPCGRQMTYVRKERVDK